MLSLIRLLAVIALTLNICIHTSDKKQEGKKQKTTHRSSNRSRRTKYSDPGAPSVRPPAHPLSDCLHADLLPIVSSYKGDLVDTIVPSYQKNWISHICFSNSGEHVVSADSDKHEIVARYINKSNAVAWRVFTKQWQPSYISLSPDDSLVATVYENWNSPVEIWNTAKTSEKKMTLFVDYMTTVAKFNPNGTHLATVGRDLLITDITTKTFTHSRGLAYPDRYKDITWFHDTTTLAALRRNGRIEIIDSKSGTATSISVPGLNDTDYSYSKNTTGRDTLALTPDNKKLIVALLDRIAIIDVVTNKLLAINLPPVYGPNKFTSATIVDSEGGPYIAATATTHDRILNYSIETCQLFDEVKEGKASLGLVKYCPQRQCFATLSLPSAQNPVVKLWQPEKIR